VTPTTPPKGLRAVFSLDSASAEMRLALINEDIKQAAH
jgi:hypothetical protein